MSDEETQRTEEQQPVNLPTPSLHLLATQLATQAMMELGEIANPVTGATEVSLPRAKFTIDMLQVLKDKTEGNLSPEELQFVEGALQEVRLKYVQQKGSSE